MVRVDAFYDAIAAQYGYEQPDESLAGLPASHVGRRYALVDAPDVVFDDDADRLFLVGLGMSGAPHVGTLSQLHAARELAAAGLDVELLLADLEKHLGSGLPLDDVTDLADRYRGLARELGYGGAIRTQSEDREVVHTAVLLSRYYERDLLDDDREPTEWEAALDRAYEEDGVDRSAGGPVTDFARKQTGALCAADFLHPLAEDGYDAFVGVFGVDEHALVRRNREMKRRADVEGRLGGLYTRIVRGLDGYPKMSKRIPASVVGLDQPPDEIRARVRAASDDRLWEMLVLAADYSPSELDALAAARSEDREEWRAAREAYADRLASLAAYW